MTHRPRTAPGVTASLAALVAPMLIGALVVLVHVPTASADAEEVARGDDPRALELVRASAAAGSVVSYSGTQYVTAWSAISSSGASSSAVVKVEHEAGGSTSVRVHGGQAAVLYGPSGTAWLAEGGGPAELLAGAYDVRLTGAGQVAGRVTDIVEAVRSDGSVAARLWLDRQTALSVRRETFAEDGSLLSASAFVELTVMGSAPCCLARETGDISTTGHGDALRRSDVERLREDGWHCPEHLGEGLVLYEARRLGEAVQLSYSDGVMTVSVFEQPGSLDPDRLDGYTATAVGEGTVYTSAGPPARFTWSTGERVVTVVADAPVDVVETVLDAMPPQDPPEPTTDDGFLDRIARGAQRVGSWLNPFD